MAKIIKDDFDTIKVYSSKKYKPKKEKKPFILVWNTCPFCHNELLIDEKKTKQAKAQAKKDGYAHLSCLFGGIRKDSCFVCGAFAVSSCPACHKPTWVQNKIFRHQRWGCGFEGERKNGN